VHPKRWLCIALQVPDVGGLVSQLIEQLRTPRRSQSDGARAVEGPCNVGLAAGVGWPSQCKRSVEARNMVEVWQFRGRGKSTQS
jgi:hypothetical protein